ncbi:hypothetical protein [Clostridium taeniosporum]|uniref:Holin n=1 Tax=Clostridium taeniosporum TaxID=394958 RepID=A0A1D7XI55_9CLOT|nr:hypothetical protein [Clostridium taeniosporum]AOR23021.1 hypothetical protein BGI42_04495 [Clostridium taeniosporum]
MKGKELIERLKNSGTIITLVSLVILVLTTNGVLVDNEKVMTTVQAICSIGVILGILNNPETDGVDLPFVSNKENKK